MGHLWLTWPSTKSLNSGRLFRSNQWLSWSPSGNSHQSSGKSVTFGKRMDKIDSSSVIPIAFLSKKTVWIIIFSFSIWLILGIYIPGTTRTMAKQDTLLKDTWFPVLNETVWLFFVEERQSYLNVKAYNSIQSIQWILVASFWSNVEDHQPYTGLVLLWNIFWLERK